MQKFTRIIGSTHRSGISSANQFIFRILNYPYVCTVITAWMSSFIDHPYINFKYVASVKPQFLKSKCFYINNNTYGYLIEFSNGLLAMQLFVI